MIILGCEKKMPTTWNDPNPGDGPAPTITSITPVNSYGGETATITGTNFGTNLDDNLVFFGMGEDYADLQLPDKNMVGYLINNNANGDNAGTILKLFNANPEAKEVTIKEGNWHVYINDKNAGTEVVEAIACNKVSVEGRRAIVLTAEEVLYNVNEYTEKLEG